MLLLFELTGLPVALTSSKPVIGMVVQAASLHLYAED